MKIRTRLLAGFALVVLLMTALAFYSASVAEKSLEQSVGRSSMFLAEEMLKTVNRNIYQQVEVLRVETDRLLFQKMLRESNEAFSRLPNVTALMDEREKAWVSVPKETVTPFMESLIQNPLAESLRTEITELHVKKYGYRIFGEIIVTNRYGAIIAETNKSTDYRQDDESWWREAKAQGLVVAGVAYDESAKMYAISVAIRMLDGAGRFAGIMKALLDPKGIVREAEMNARKYTTTWIQVITADGRRIYSTKAYQFMEDVSNTPLFKAIRAGSGFFTGRFGDREVLYSYARSTGYRGFEGLDWILLVGHQATEVLAPATSLKSRLLFVSLVLVTVALVIAVFISRSITRPVARLVRGAEAIGGGNLDYRIDLSGRDALVQLADTFNTMAKRLKHHRDASRATTSRLEYLLTSSPAVIYTSRASGNYGATFISDNIREQLGYEPRDFLNDPQFWIEHIHPDDRAHVLENLKLPFEHGVHTHEYRFRLKDGTYQWMRDELKLMRDDTGAPVEIVGCWINIDDRKTVEEALMESEQRFRGFFDFSAMGMAMGEPEGRFIQVNPTFCKMMGYEREALVGRSFQSLVEPGDLEKEMPLVERLIRGEITHYQLEERLIHRTGRPVWARVTVSLVRDASGAPQNLIANIEDTTRRRKDRKKIEQHHLTMEGINRVFREALTCETDTDVARIGLQVAEELTESRFGFIGEINADGLFDTMAMSNPGWDACRMPDSKSAGIIKGMKLRGIHRVTLGEGKSQVVNDPEHHPLRTGVPEGHPPITCFLSVPLKQAEKTIGMIGLANKEPGYEPHDLHMVERLAMAVVEALTNKRNEMEIREHRHHLEQMVAQRTAELERSNSELQQFAYVASHDLQEPLRKVQSFGDRFVARYADQVDERGRDYLARMKSAVGRMGTMIQDLLTLSRVTTQGDRFGPVDLMKEVNTVLSDMESTIDAHGGLFELGELPVIEADGRQIRQLMLNLISNAFKYRKPETAPFVKIHAKTVGTKAQPLCEILVEDNGIGFEETYLDRIFQPFQRLHGRSSPYEGSGMGLAICQKIVERHGGTITATSVPGRGSTFAVTLPVKQTREADK